MKLLKEIKRRLFGEDWGPEAVKVPAKWRKAGGRGVRVLVIDTGAPAQGVAVAECRNFVWNEEIEDLGGHATAVCGIIRRYAPKCGTVCYKAIDKSGHSDGCMNVLAALRAAVTDGGFGVVNVSLAAYRGASKLHEPIRELAADGTIVVAGAGNDPEKGVAYPARFDEVLAVAASDRGRMAGFSAPGDVMMPGTDVVCRALGGGWRIASGTSLAAAAASGLFALALSAGLDATEAKEAVFKIAGVRP